MNIYELNLIFTVVISISSPALAWGIVKVYDAVNKSRASN